MTDAGGQAALGGTLTGGGSSPTRERTLRSPWTAVIVAAVLSVPAIYFATDRLVGMATVLKVGDKSFTGMSLFYCSLVGLAITGIIAAAGSARGCPAGARAR